MILAYFLKLFSRLPMPILYAIGDLLYIIMYYGLGYRKNLIIDNLKNAFPTWSDKEINLMLKKNYRYFTEFIFEVIKSLSETHEERNKKVSITNPESYNQFARKNQGQILIGGHHGNWELLSFYPQMLEGNFYIVYKPLTNKIIDDLIKKARSKFGCNMVSMRETRAKLMQTHRNKEPFVFGFISDQSPAPEKTKFWCSFMGRVVPWYTGAAELAIATKSAFTFQKGVRVRRGCYEITNEIIAEDASQHSMEYLMEAFVKKLEAAVKEQPEIYLWTHKRWKHTNRVSEFENNPDVTVIK
jgi:KDO2-lipid IV(A) lauroyltransferase